MNSGPSILEYIGMEVISAIICVDDFSLYRWLLNQSSGARALRVYNVKALVKFFRSFTSDQVTPP
jgi:hypothetical protein